MHSHHNKWTYYFQADANALGGVLKSPAPKVIPSQASVSLPAVGGFASNRTHAFNLDDVVSCFASYARVSGSEVGVDGSASVLVTSVVEGLNILEILTAERVVAQVSVAISYDPESGRRRRVISLAGSSFQGLRVGGFETRLKWNAGLLRSERNDRAEFQRTGAEQANRMIDSLGGDTAQGAHAWALNRFGWMAHPDKREDEEWVLCSLVDGVEPTIPGKCFGHVVEIPDFGRILLGELIVSADSIRLAMVRAELGCHVNGGIGAGVISCNGHTVPPIGGRN